MNPTLTIESAGRTHVGLVRRRNEDALHLGPYLVAVADGLGGHVAGDVASRTVIEALRGCPQPVTSERRHLTGMLGRAIDNASVALRRRVEADPALAGMGSTLVAMLISGTAAALANVGDSRAYRLRRDGDGARTVQLTEDHTYQHLVADAASVPDLPGKLARFLDGRADGRSPDLTVLPLAPGDRYLLCSDGLSSYVPHRLIHQALCAGDAGDDVADQLIDLALHQGAPDNVTVAVIDVQPGGGAAHAR
jgi:protein phosphatase